MSNELAVQQAEPTELSFGSTASFTHLQRVATLFASSQLVPTAFQGNVPNCTIALSMAARMQADPFAVIQQLSVIHGKPSFSSQFLIASINTCGRFLPIRFHLEGNGDSLSCIAWTIEKAVAKEFSDLLGKLVTLPAARNQVEVPFLEGPAVTMEMARAEGWLNKSGSKWKTMPELMIRYRAAAFFVRLYAPEITMGMRPTEEVIDLEPDDVRNVTTRTEVTSVQVESEPAPAVKQEPKVRKGVSKAEPKPVEASAPAATVAPESAATPAPATPAPAPAAAPAAGPESKVCRCEFERMVQRAVAEGKPPSCEVALTGEYIGTAYFSGLVSQLPDIGIIADVTLETRYNADRTRSAVFVTGIELVA